MKKVVSMIAGLAVVLGVGLLVLDGRSPWQGQTSEDSESVKESDASSGNPNPIDGGLSGVLVDSVGRGGRGPLGERDRGASEWSNIADDRDARSLVWRFSSNVYAEAFADHVRKKTRGGIDLPVSRATDGEWDVLLRYGNERQRDSLVVELEKITGFRIDLGKD